MASPIKPKTLHMPLWQELVYLCFIAVGPIVITSLELFTSHSSAFKWSFGTLALILMAVMIIKKFVLNNKIKDFKTKCVLLEHDYSIQVGNPTFIKLLWKKYNLYLYLYNTVTVSLALGLFYIFIMALLNQIIAFKGAATLIMISLIIGMIFKVITFAVALKTTNSEEGAENEED